MPGRQSTSQGTKIGISGECDNMKDKDLHKLNRAELLELLLSQSREIERLKSELETANKKLANRKIRISESGSIAEAALKLTDIFAEAQKAADLYLDNIKMGGAGK